MGEMQNVVAGLACDCCAYGGMYADAKLAPGATDRDCGLFVESRRVGNAQAARGADSGTAWSDVDARALGNSTPTYTTADAAGDSARFGWESRLLVLPQHPSLIRHSPRPYQENQRNVPGMPRAEFQCAAAYAPPRSSFGRWARGMPAMPLEGR